MDSHTFCCNFESCDHRRETSVFSVPVDINDNSGRTPLWFAARDGDVCCVDVLLKHGASPQHESMRGSPLEITKEQGHSDVVEMMEEAMKLTSHPYVEGHMSVMRHQYQQKIAELQCEIIRLRTAAADKNLSYLLSVFWLVIGGVILDWC
ncbi:inversin-like [Corticium candelabrum]|uniref:inversin-like n=1 Tax=Corticium candelabrum TaxID=121492 RepID=UPI002E25FF41|nr:inversin-like [Corticium candelabrum]